MERNIFLASCQVLNNVALSRFVDIPRDPVKAVNLVIDVWFRELGTSIRLRDYERYIGVMAQIFEYAMQSAVKSENMLRDELYAFMANMHEEKNADYGDSWSESLTATAQLFGYKSALVIPAIRIREKCKRVQQLLNNGMARVKSESVDDSLVDAACYIVMTYVWICDHTREIDEEFLNEPFTV